MEISEEEAWIIIGMLGDEDGEITDEELKLEKRIRKEFPTIDEKLKKKEHRNHLLEHEVEQDKRVKEARDYYCINCGRWFTTNHKDTPIACPWCAETTFDGNAILQEVRKNRDDTYLDNKHADIKATRDNDFYYAWTVNGKVISVEYIPMNWPAVTVLIANEKTFDIERKIEEIKNIGYEIEGEEK